MNDPRRSQRPRRLPGGGEGTQLHESRGAARRLAIGAEPHAAGTRGAARGSTPDAHHAQRGTDRGGRTSASDGGSAVRRDRCRTRRAERVPREAGRHRPDHDGRARGRGDPVARPGKAPAGLSGRQGGADRRLRPDRHRRRALRRGRPPRRAGGEGHDRRPDRAGHAHGGGRGTLLLRAAEAAANAAGAHGPRLHQHPPADPRWPICLGVREGRARTEGAGRGAAGVQQHRAEAERGPSRVRPGLPARGSGTGALRRRAAHPRARRLVSTLPGLPPLLPEPPATHPSLRPAGRSATLPGLSGMELFETIVGLLLVAALLASLADRIGVPYPALLALAGTGMAFIPGVPVVTPDPALALALFVAPTLLDSAFDASPRDLRDNLLPVVTLAVVCVGITIAAVAVAARWC